MRAAASALILFALAAPAGAQRLEYRAVDDRALAAPPRLAYRAVEGDSEPAGSSRPAQGEAVAERRKLLQWGLLDRFEYGAQRGEDGYSWDFSALLGGDRNRLWLASVGEGPAWAGPDYLEFHALYSRSVGGNVDLNLGLRWDAVPNPQRGYATFGAQFDNDKLWLGAFAYWSDKGEPSLRLAGLYNWGLAKALYLQPSFELDATGEDAPELGIYRGFYYAEAGLRLRYEIAEAFAPYLGVSWERSLGRTARVEREAGEDPETKSIVLGIRSSF